MELSGKVAVVTGAGRGIGREIALRLGREGAQVAIVELAATDGEKVRKEIESLGREALALSADVANLQEVEDAFDKILDKFGGIDILVNNAGIVRDNLLLRMKEEEWDQVIAVNLKGCFNCSRSAIRAMMKKKSGKIVNISSVIALLGNAGQVNYAASKAGIIGFTRSLAREVAGRGICVNAVAPGFIETDMTSGLSDEVKSEMHARIPLGRFGRAEEVAETVLFLASERSDYITGQVVQVNGGM